MVRVERPRLSRSSQRAPECGRGRLRLDRELSVLGDWHLMRGMTVSWLSRRALFSATACAAFVVALGSIPSRAQEQDVSQAEWPQSYETSPKMAIQREATPILSSATVDATQAAIQKYQDIVARGGWESARAGPEQRVGSKGGAVEALRQRLVATGDLDPVAGSGPVYDSLVEAGVKRFQARNGLKRR